MFEYKISKITHVGDAHEYIFLCLRQKSNLYYLFFKEIFKRFDFLNLSDSNPFYKININV
jgi:hypothetical protein